MVRKTSYPPRKSEIFLGQQIKKVRIRLAMSQMQLGRIVNDSCQQIDRYETGALIPLAKLEDLAEALGVRIPKKIIRRVSIERKLQTETEKERSEELIELYEQAFPEDEEDEKEEDEKEEE